MQIALTGVHPDTIKTVKSVDELKDLRLYDQPLFTTLAHFASSAKIRHSHEPLMHDLEVLSKELRKWRKVHRGIVRLYLAESPEGTGGTDGPDYLKHTVDTTISGTAELLRHVAKERSDSWPKRDRDFDLLPKESTHGKDFASAEPVLTASN